MNVRQAAWSRDGSRLALLTTSEDADRSAGDDGLGVGRGRGARSPRCRATADTAIAANSELTWLPDGSKLVVALRDAADDRAAQSTLQEAGRRPDRRPHRRRRRFSIGTRCAARIACVRSPSSIRAPVTRASLLPPTKLTDYQLSRDGSFMTFREDATEKTDYDVISGTNNHLKDRASGRAPRRWSTRRALKTTNPRWSDDGRIFA